MNSWVKLSLWICGTLIGVAGLGIGAIVLINAVTSRGRWAAAVDFVVPAIAGFGALVVAVASWQTAVRATKIASDSAHAEEGRLREDRYERYEWRLDEALVEIAKMLAAHRLLLTRILSAEMMGKSTKTLRSERQDNAFELGSELGIVGMVARGEDSEIIELTQSALHKAATHPDEQHMRLVMAISAVIQAWRSEQPHDSAAAKKTLQTIIRGGIMAD